MRQILAVLVAVATVALLQGLFYTFRFIGEKKRQELRRRLQTAEATETVQLNLLRRGKLAHSAWLSNLLRGLPTAERLERLMQQAQAPLTVAQLITYSVMLAIFGGFVGARLPRSVPRCSSSWPSASVGATSSRNNFPTHST
jgi:Tfp pilus assembly protein PilO